MISLGLDEDCKWDLHLADYLKNSVHARSLVNLLYDESPESIRLKDYSSELNTI